MFNSHYAAQRFMFWATALVLAVVVMFSSICAPAQALEYHYKGDGRELVISTGIQPDSQTYMFQIEEGVHTFIVNNDEREVLSTVYSKEVEILQHLRGVDEVFDNFRTQEDVAERHTLWDKWISSLSFIAQELGQ
jgi:hypothetical protein